jgi:thiamine biosynthesis lipoprotein
MKHYKRSSKKLEADSPSITIRHTTMGSPWEIDLWTDLPKEPLHERVVDFLESFNNTYSRFRDDALIAQLRTTSGHIRVPQDFVKMIRMYIKIYTITDGLMNPLIGQSLSDVGYDKDYSLRPRDVIAQTPDLVSAIQIIDDTHIYLREPVLVDLGAIGKGYAVDLLVQLLKGEGVLSGVVNGSGDMFHWGELPLEVGLEHPGDASKVIGTIPLQNAAIASSSSNRRAWAHYHHILDPHTNTSPDSIMASWVRSSTTAEADLLATALFLVPPEALQKAYSFEYVLVNKELRYKTSAGWQGTLFQ